MMGTLFRLFFLAALGLVFGWAAYFLVPSLAGTCADREESWYRGAFPLSAKDTAGDLLRAVRVPKSLRLVPGGGEGTLIRGGSIVLCHFRVASGFVPFFVVLILVAGLAGLIVRERLRLGGAYASPTSGFLAKRLVEGVTLALILWVFSPVPAPYWTLYPVGLAGMAGLWAYVANLPLRL